MMQHSRLEGTEILLHRFDTIAVSAREQLGVELAIIGRDLLDIQRADVPVDTGLLKRDLRLEPLLSELKVRVGLIGFYKSSRSRRRSYGDAFYARFVEFGVRAQPVHVERRKRVSVHIGDGVHKNILRTSKRRKIEDDIVARYSYTLKAQPARPFIFVPKAQEYALQQLANYWSKTLSRAGV